MGSTRDIWRNESSINCIRGKHRDFSSSWIAVIWMSLTYDLTKDNNISGWGRRTLHKNLIWEIKSLKTVMTAQHCEHNWRHWFEHVKCACKIEFLKNCYFTAPLLLCIIKCEQGKWLFISYPTIHKPSGKVVEEMVWGNKEGRVMFHAERTQAKKEGSSQKKRGKSTQRLLYTEAPPRNLRKSWRECWTSPKHLQVDRSSHCSWLF